MSTASLVTVPRGRPTVSFELYPPRTPANAATAWETVERLAAAAPDFFSVTYGASGSARAWLSVMFARWPIRSAGIMSVF